jgi:hypothetical protein
MVSDPMTENIAAPLASPNVDNRPSTTTSEQDLRTAGQRQINLLWERTQAGIAIAIVISNIAYIFALLVFTQVTNAATTAATLLGNGFFLIVGFYFGRTNHARIGDDPSRRRETSAMDDR